MTKNVCLAQQARPVYEELIELIRQCAVVYADETGWRIGILSAWLWVFTNRQVTVYTIKEGRGHEVVVEILGKQDRPYRRRCGDTFDSGEYFGDLPSTCVTHG